MAKGKFSYKGLKICCGVTIIILIVIALIFTTLAFTIFKPKNPEINVHLNNFLPVHSANMTLSMVITIQNPNYGSFKFKNSTGSVNYHGEVVADVPIEGNYVPPRSTIEIKTVADLMVDKVLSNPQFLEDLAMGSLNFTSTAVLQGKAIVLKVFKLHATTYSTCDISIFPNITQDINATCISNIKL